MKDERRRRNGGTKNIVKIFSSVIINYLIFSKIKKKYLKKVYICTVVLL